MSPSPILTIASRPSPIGPLLIAATESGICALHPGGDLTALKARLLRHCPSAQFQTSPHQRLQKWLDVVVSSLEDFTEADSAASIPLTPFGTTFQQEVWNALRSIPLGATLSYSNLAERLNRPRATRAVAQACGANPVAILIPCHRVIGANGRLTGYRWGIERKRFLLEKEKAAVHDLEPAALL